MIINTNEIVSVQAKRHYTKYLDYMHQADMDFLGDELMDTIHGFTDAFTDNDQVACDIMDEILTKLFEMRKDGYDPNSIDT